MSAVGSTEPKAKGQANVGATNTADSADRVIVQERYFDAPRALVWKAWTDAKHLDKWWGPNGYVNQTFSMEFRVGGSWRYVMHGPDGKDWQNLIHYDEIVPNERLVYRHAETSLDDPHAFHVTVTFEDAGNRTKVTMRSIFATAEACAAVKKFGAVEGGQQTLERLSEHLANLGAVTKPFVISREFAAPRELVFRAWTEREHLIHWWGPKGVKIVACANDLRPGGTMHYCMRTADGHDMWGLWAYREIIPPERLVYVSSFSDEKGSVIHHAQMREWPLEILSTITFTERQGRTTVTVEFVPLNPTEVEKKTFEGGHGSMMQGWGGTLDQLGDYLAQRTQANPPATAARA